MNKQKKVRVLTIALCSILILPVAMMGISYMFPVGTVSDVSVVEIPVESFESYDSNNEQLTWHGIVTVSKNGEVVYQGHNLLTDAGADHIKACLGAGTCGNAFDYIAVGNGTAPTTGSTSLNGEIADSGLSRAQGSYTSLGTGHWKIEKVFTATGSTMANSTGLFNASSSGTMIAGDTYTQVSLEENDQLNVSWDITQS